jgi:CheY-like chemotaxis protein
MVLCAVDDLMFTSKLRVAAAQTGVQVAFVRSPEALLAEIGRARPSLVVLDLNADRLRPFEMLESLARDPGLEGLRTVAFVSHVQADRIAAARAAGASDVMARSAFVAQLPEILQWT